MAFIKINLVVGSEKYQAEIDTEADPKSIAQSLATDLKLRAGNYKLVPVTDINPKRGSTWELIGPNTTTPGRILNADEEV